MASINGHLDTCIEKMTSIGKTTAVAPTMFAFALLSAARTSINVIHDVGRTVAEQAEAARVLAPALRCFRAFVNAIDNKTGDIAFPIKFILLRCTNLIKTETAENVEKLVEELGEVDVIKLMQNSLKQVKAMSTRMESFLPDGRLVRTQQRIKARNDALSARLATVTADGLRKNSELRKLMAELANVKQNGTRSTAATHCACAPVISDLKDKIRQLDWELYQAQSELQAARSRLPSLDGRIKAHKGELCIYLEKIAQIREEHLADTRTIEDLREDHLAVFKKMEQARDRVVRLLAELDVVRDPRRRDQIESDAEAEVEARTKETDAKIAQFERKLQDARWMSGRMAQHHRAAISEARDARLELDGMGVGGQPQSNPIGGSGIADSRATTTVTATPTPTVPRPAVVKRGSGNADSRATTTATATPTVPRPAVVKRKESPKSPRKRLSSGSESEGAPAAKKLLGGSSRPPSEERDGEKDKTSDNVGEQTGVVASTEQAQFKPVNVLSQIGVDRREKEDVEMPEAENDDDEENEERDAPQLIADSTSDASRVDDAEHDDFDDSKSVREVRRK